MRKLSMVIAVIALVNFIAFAIEYLILGGEALNGTITEGHHYVTMRGVVSEVSHPAFVFSTWHARSLFVTQPLGMLAAW